MCFVLHVNFIIKQQNLCFKHPSWTRYRCPLLLFYYWIRNIYNFKLIILFRRISLCRCVNYLKGKWILWLCMLSRLYKLRHCIQNSRSLIVLVFLFQDIKYQAIEIPVFLLMAVFGRSKNALLFINFLSLSIPMLLKWNQREKKLYEILIGRCPAPFKCCVMRFYFTPALLIFLPSFLSGGLSGALYNYINCKLTVFRKK